MSVLQRFSMNVDMHLAVKNVTTQAVAVKTRPYNMNRNTFKGTKCHMLNSAHCANSIGVVATPVHNRFQILSQCDNSIGTDNQPQEHVNVGISVSKHPVIKKQSKIDTQKTVHLGKRNSISTVAQLDRLEGNSFNQTQGKFSLVQDLTPSKYLTC